MTGALERAAEVVDAARRRPRWRTRARREIGGDDAELVGERQVVVEPRHGTPRLPLGLGCLVGEPLDEFVH
jgi:hypothetical protein